MVSHVHRYVRYQIGNKGHSGKAGSTQLSTMFVVIKRTRNNHRRRWRALRFVEVRIGIRYIFYVFLGNIQNNRKTSCEVHIKMRMVLDLQEEVEEKVEEISNETPHFSNDN